MSTPDHEKNRIAWNEMVEVHINHPSYRLKDFLNGWNSLKSIELEHVGDVTGKKLLHLMCQFGMDTLSWARKGAIVTGVDISDNSIKQANELKTKVGLDRANFVRFDVNDLIGKIDKKFDIVFQSYGTHCWIEDLNQWAKVVAHYLKPGGFFYIIDDHPLMTLYLTEDYGYLSKEAERYANVRDYTDFDYIVKNERVEWQHPISEFVNCLINAGLTIEFMHEYDIGYYEMEKGWVQTGDYWTPPEGPTRHPLMFALRAKKEA